MTCEQLGPQVFAGSKIYFGEGPNTAPDGGNQKWKSSSQKWEARNTAPEVGTRNGAQAAKLEARKSGKVGVEGHHEWTTRFRRASTFFHRLLAPSWKRAAANQSMK